MAADTEQQSPLRRERKRLGLTLQEVADGAGCSQMFVSYAERGLRRAPDWLIAFLGARAGIALLGPAQDAWRKQHAEAAR